MTYRDEFSEPPRGPNLLGGIGSKTAFFAVLIALSFMLGVVWKLYVGSGEQQGQNVPIVRADEEGYKVLPDDPGGMDIPHRDSTIFSSLKSGDKEGGSRIENLLARDDNEEPLPRSQLFAGLNTYKSPILSLKSQDSPLDKPVGQAVEPLVTEERTPQKIVAPKKVKPVVEPAVVKPKVEETKTIEKIIEQTAKTKIEPKAAPVPKMKVTPKTKPKVKAVVKSTSNIKSKSSIVAVESAPLPTTGEYYIQLGSVKTSSGAESEWSKIQKRYSSQLSGYSHRVETADLGAKGVFYRIQAGPVSKDQAISTCSAIKKITAGGCLVKKK